MAGENACAIMTGLIILAWITQPLLIAHLTSKSSDAANVQVVQPPAHSTPPSPTTTEIPRLAKEVPLDIQNCSISLIQRIEDSPLGDSQVSNEDGDVTHSNVTTSAVIMCMLPNVQNLSVVETKDGVKVPLVLLARRESDKPWTEAEHRVAIRIFIQWSLTILLLITVIGYMLYVAIQPCVPNDGGGCCCPYARRH